MTARKDAWQDTEAHHPCGYVVLEVLEVDDGWTPPPLTVEQRRDRSVEGMDVVTAGNAALFSVKGTI